MVLVVHESSILSCELQVYNVVGSLLYILLGGSYLHVGETDSEPNSSLSAALLDHNFETIKGIYN